MQEPARHREGIAYATQLYPLLGQNGEDSSSPKGSASTGSDTGPCRGPDARTCSGARVAGFVAVSMCCVAALTILASWPQTAGARLKGAIGPGVREDAVQSQLKSEYIPEPVTDNQTLAGDDRPSHVLHLLILAIDDVPHGKLWRSFFDAAKPGQYRIWLHCKHREKCEAGDFMRRMPETTLVPSVPSAYCTDLITPEVQLLGHALAAGTPPGTAEKFVITSDSTLPVKPFGVIYDELTAEPKSDFCVYPLCPKGVCKFNPNYWAKGVQMGKTVGVASVVMTSQFVVLNRPDAEKFAGVWGPPGKRPLRPVHVSTWDGKEQVPTVKSQPAWPVRVYGGSPKTGADEHQLGKVSSANFTGWDSCIDEEAVFSAVFGAVVLEANSTVDVPGFGSISAEKRYMEEPQGTCRTYFSFAMWSLDDKRLERELSKDKTSDVQLASMETGSHPLVFGNLSRSALQLLRKSHWLFARKFEPTAFLDDFESIILK